MHASLLKPWWGLFTVLCVICPFTPEAAPEPSTLTSARRLDDKATDESFARGVVISCPGSGRSWGSDAMVARMKALSKVGTTAVQIHPYAGIRNDGQVRNRSFKDPENPPTWITRPIAEAKKLGLKVMMKPHIAYWGSRFSWRGEIEFDNREAWARFFRDYESWIVNLARMSQGADCFVIGTELDKTLGHEKSWRRIIAAVRKVYRGKITYAANWTDYERVPFWDALDVIGIQAYFPIVKENLDAKTPKTPSARQISEGWNGVVKRLDKFAEKTKKPIVLTELGYNRSHAAALRPWAYQTHGPEAEPLQCRCLETALKAVEKSRHIHGLYLWKCFPGARPPRDFNLHAPAIVNVIKKTWGAGPAPKIAARPGSPRVPSSPSKDKKGS